MIPLIALTIVLDGEPFIEQHLPVFDKLTIPWRWIIAEGAAMNVGSTRWCHAQEPRLSRDGTMEYLTRISSHPNVTILRKQEWAGKDEQVNACLAKIKEPCILLQCDSDECWTAEQLTKIHRLLSDGEWVRAYFACNFYVGPNIAVTPELDPVNNVWLRAWRFTPGDTFSSHEPPILKQQAQGYFLSQGDTRERDLVFEHYSYVYEHQVRYKEQFYGYTRAVEHWKRLQANKKWPVELKRFFPWAKPGAMATLVK